MAGSLLKRFVLPAAILVTGFGAAAALSTSLERGRPQLSENYYDSDLEVKASKIRGFTFGMDGLIADWYYMRALQYIGQKMIASKAEYIDLGDLRPLNPRLLYPLLDNATDLDPNFLAAYYYGAVVLPGIDGEQAISIARKGIEKNPSAWRLYQHLGYIHWKLGNYDLAAEAYEAGSNIPGAAGFMKLMAGTMRTQGGSRLTARQIFRQMYEGTDDPGVRSTAEIRLKELDRLDQREAIDGVLAEFKTRNGRCVRAWDEALPLLLAVDLPKENEFRVDASNRLTDPFDEPYVLDKENCIVGKQPGRIHVLDK